MTLKTISAIAVIVMAQLSGCTSNPISETSATFSSKASQGLDTSLLPETRLPEPITLIFDDSFNELDGIVREVEGGVLACPVKLYPEAVFNIQNQVTDALTRNIGQQLTPTSVVLPNDFYASDVPPLSLWFSVYTVSIENPRNHTGMYSSSGFQVFTLDAELAIRVTLRVTGRIVAQDIASSSLSIKRSFNNQGGFDGIPRTTNCDDQVEALNVVAFDALTEDINGRINAFLRQHASSLLKDQHYEVTR